MGSPTIGFCLIFLFIFYQLPCVPSQKEPSGYCEALFHCGNITLGFPFSGENRRQSCGHPSLGLKCNKSSNTTSLSISGHNYNILHIDNKSNILRLSRQDFSGPFCSASFSSTLFPSVFFEILPSYKSLIVFYVCDTRRHFLWNFTCPSPMKGLGSVVQDSTYYKTCDKSFSVIVPTSFVPEEEALSLTHLENVMRQGFEVKLKLIDDIFCEVCVASGSNCGFFGAELVCCKTLRSGNIDCYTFYESYNVDGTNTNRSILIISGSVAGSILTVFIVMILAFLFWERRTKNQENAQRDQNLDALVTLRRYSHKQIKKITKSFTEVVGRGGFGTVYKGRLRDGSKVAVKVLKDSKGNCEDFINEVASMSQTSHVNIVSLLGFCYEGSKRAIVYEFLENGSLDQFISSEKSGDKNVSMLYGMALGVAKGLEYLHYGCKMRIVHFDIKPQNVLLDDNLRPKVADFGLAKLCEKQESILSLLDTRGTVGYIAPELFSRMYGSVSHKSDVYSYGMLVFEMIGARNKERVEKADSNNSSVYFPDWIYKDLENGDITKLLADEVTQEEEEIAKRMILVGLWCIQLCPADRPPMNKVVEMMEGSLDSLEAPPKPHLHLPMGYISESSRPSEGSTVIQKYDSMSVENL